MLKATITILCIFVFYPGLSQKKIFSTEEQAILDSILKDDEFFKMLKKELGPKSYFLAQVTAGNTYFSLMNKRINASHLESKFTISPSVSYMNKSGFGVMAMASLSNFERGFDIYQSNISPSFALLKNKRISASISYTRFFTNRKYENIISPIKNDLYLTCYLKKLWLQPGVSVGFSSGRNRMLNRIDTVLLGIQRKFIDTVTTTLKAFSLNAFIQHSFEYYELLGKKDAISISPKLLLNAGSNNYEEIHKNPYVTFIQKNTRRKNFGRLQDNTSFQFQSVALNLDINYLIGKFGIEPQAYFDYYIPETTDTHFTTVYSVTLSYTF
ncbi:MAG: hypothetical protein ABIO04_04190 [Ferruginibacter sp.]